MTIYRTNDGEKYEAGSAKEFVALLRRTSRAPSRDVSAFMKQASKRALIQNGAHIRTSSPIAFVRDLVKAGLVTQKG